MTARCKNPACGFFMSWSASRGARIADASCFTCGSPIRKSSAKEEHEAARARVNAQPTPDVQYAFTYKDGDRYFVATSHDLAAAQGIAQGRNEYRLFPPKPMALPIEWKPGDPIPDDLTRTNALGRYLRYDA